DPHGRARRAPVEHRRCPRIAARARSAARRALRAHAARAARSARNRRAGDDHDGDSGNRLDRARRRPQLVHAARVRSARGRGRRVRRALQGALRTPVEGDLRKMSPLLSAASFVALLLLTLAIALSLLRMLRGPTAQDRILSFDMLYVVAMLLMLVLGLR